MDHVVGTLVQGALDPKSPDTRLCNPAYKVSLSTIPVEVPQIAYVHPRHLIFFGPHTDECLQELDYMKEEIYRSCS
jgi:hypothetical protein